MPQDTRNPQGSRAEFADDPLWDILGRPEAPQPGPFFVQQTMQRVRATRRGERVPMSGWMACLGPIRVGLVAGAFAVGVAGALFLASNPFGEGDAADLAMTSATEFSQGTATLELASDDLEVIRDLDILVAQEEISLWTEDVF